MIERSRRRRVVRVGLVAVAAACALALAAPAAGWACSNVEFIGVRGSGESYSGNYGMGVQVADLYERFRAGEPAGQSLQSYGLAYPAVNVAQWWTAWDYFKSVEEGKHNLEARLNSDASACPEMKIVLGGFSQGAHVVGGTVENLANENPALLEHVYGVALYGDPRFNPEDFATARGDYNPEHWGILTKRPPYSWLINERLGDWCRLEDAICQGFNAGNIEHHEYTKYLGGQFLQEGAELMFFEVGW